MRCLAICRSRSGSAHRYWCSALGATDDGAFTQDEVHATARAYDTDAQFFPDMGHDMMLEPGWQAVAERIVQWLGHRGL